MFVIKDDSGKIVKVVVYGVVYTAPQDPAELPAFMQEMYEVLKDGR